MSINNFCSHSGRSLTARQYRWPPLPNQRGFTLVELMIAMGLSATLLFGVLQIFDANKQSSRMQHALVEVQENGRIAAEILARDIRMADYWGCMDVVSNINNVLDLDASDAEESEFMFDSSQGVTGTNNVAANTQIEAITLVAGSDTLSLKTSASMSNVRISHEMPSTAAVLKIENIDGIEIPKGTVLLVTDCDSADVFSNTSDKTYGDGGPSELQIQHNGGNNGEFIDNTTNKLSKSYGADAQIMLPRTRTYFVGKAADKTVSSLYMQENGGIPQELIRHVENIQFKYGVDSNDDGTVDKYLDAPTPAEMDLALSVRAVISTHSKNTVASGAVLKRDFTVTGTIRNRII